MIKTAKVVGLNSDTEAALALACSGGLGFYALVSCQIGDAFSRARQALSEAEGTFFSSAQTIPERLTETLEIVKKSLSDTENLQVILAAVAEDQQGSVLYLLGEGKDLKVNLYRNGKESDLLGTSSGELVSGILEAGDRVILITKSLLEFLGDGHVLRDTPIGLLEDEINASLPEADNYPVAAIILEVEQKAKEGSEPILEVQEKMGHDHILRNIVKSKIILGIMVAALLLGGLSFFFLQKNKAENLQQVKLQEQKAVELQKEAKEKFEEFEVGDIPLWLDLNLIKEGFIADKLSLSLGRLLILDQGQKTLVTVNLANKSQQILAGKEKLGEAVLASLNGDLAWVLSEDKGLLRVDEDKKVLVVERSDEEWGQILGLFGFARNAYLLDKAGQIWKYVPVEGGYSDKLKYFKEETKVDFLDVKRMQIDSSIWVLKNNGEILKFTQGVSDHFSYSGLDKPIKDAKSFFISEDTDDIYILDSGNNRLLVLDKKGVYKAQYLGDKFGSFEDLVVDGKNKKAYLLDEGKIYQMELK